MTLKSLTATTHVERFQGVRVMYCRSDCLRIDSSNYMLLHAQRVGVVCPIHRPLTDDGRSCMRCVCPSRLLRHSRNSRPFMAVRINKQADILTYILSIYQSRRTIERTIEHQSNVMREIHIPLQVCFPPQCLD